MKNYKTVANDEIFFAKYEVKKSVFLAHVKHVETEETAREFVQEIRKKYFDATHNCSAWIFGEPGGTAGNPILETIRKKELTNTAVVVTRYFGGIKLGAGGLIRAYSHTATLGLDAAKIIHMKTFQKVELTLEYNFLAQVENFLRQKNITVTNSEYTEIVTLTVIILPNDVENFLLELTNLTAANILYELKEQLLIAKDCL